MIPTRQPRRRLGSSSCYHCCASVVSRRARCALARASSSRRSRRSSRPPPGVFRLDGGERDSRRPVRLPDGAPACIGYPFLAGVAPNEASLHVALTAAAKVCWAIVEVPDASTGLVVRVPTADALVAGTYALDAAYADANADGSDATSSSYSNATTRDDRHRAYGAVAYHSAAIRRRREDPPPVDRHAYRVFVSALPFDDESATPSPLLLVALSLETHPPAFDAAKTGSCAATRTAGRQGPRGRAVPGVGRGGARDAAEGAEIRAESAGRAGCRGVSRRRREDGRVLRRRRRGRAKVRQPRRTQHDVM